MFTRFLVRKRMDNHPKLMRLKLLMTQISSEKCWSRERNGSPRRGDLVRLLLN